MADRSKVVKANLNGQSLQILLVELSFDLDFYQHILLQVGAIFCDLKLDSVWPFSGYHISAPR